MLKDRVFCYSCPLVLTRMIKSKSGHPMSHVTSSFATASARQVCWEGHTAWPAALLQVVCWKLSSRADSVYTAKGGHQGSSDRQTGASIAS